MLLSMLKAKIHRARVTHCELHYEGSFAIAEDLLEATGILENEQVHIWNTANDEQFTTYAIRGERGSGIISLSGSAATEWIKLELEAIHRAATSYAAEHGLHAPTMEQVAAAERYARGCADCGSKWALWCSPRRCPQHLTLTPTPDRVLKRNRSAGSHSARTD